MTGTSHTIGLPLLVSTYTWSALFLGPLEWISLTTELLVIIGLNHQPGFGATNRRGRARSHGTIANSIKKVLCVAGFINRAFFVTRRSDQTSIQLEPKIADTYSLLSISVRFSVRTME
jgi:hypothetical protein